MSRLDGFLSRKLQAVWPDALVFRNPALQSDDLDYHARRANGEITGLGKTFHEARQAVAAIVAAAKARSAMTEAEVVHPNSNEPEAHEDTE